MLRGIFIILLFNIFPIWVCSQQPYEMRTLLSEDARISAFGGINSGFSPFNSNYTTFIGGEGAFVLNNVYIGGYGSRTFEYQTIHQDDVYYTDKKVSLSQGGILTGMSFRSKKMLQYEVGAQLGWGHLSLRENSTKKILTRDRINTFTPFIRAKLNLTSYIQLCVGASYQFLVGVDFPKLSDKDFQGICGAVSLRFGWF